jgi:energy-coupling factor transport system ATP-binding protein
LEPDIVFKNVSFQYAGSDTWALQDIDLEIQPGEAVLITGPSGSGKTTLCSCILGLVPHHHEGQLLGQLIVRGRDVAKTRIGALAAFVGMVFQDPESQLVAPFVIDEVAFGAENLGVPREEIERRVTEALEIVRLNGFEDRQPYLLSGGEQQACAIAAIYAMYPEIYVMDEPTSNLDPLGTQRVLSLLARIARERGKTLILVEHKLEEVLHLVDRIIVMDRGRVVRHGAVDDVLAAGDLPHVFSRPPIVQLAERLGLDSAPRTADDLYPHIAGRLKARPAPVAPIQQTNHHDDEIAIDIRDLGFAYGAGAPALSGVSLTIRRGEMAALLGRNGSGKSTLIRHINRLLAPAAGRVFVFGQDVAQTTTAQIARRVGFCFQNPNHQMISFTVRDELAYGLKIRGASPDEIKRRSVEALAFVGLSDALEEDVLGLGKGQRQRLALASVLTLDPEILIFDEPTTGQDPQMTADIFQILRRLNAAGTTILLVTHNLEMAARFTDRAVILKQGRIVYDGRMQALLGQRALLHDNSIDQPQLTRLAIQLAGADHAPTPLTVDEFLIAFPELQPAE